MIVKGLALVAEMVVSAAFAFGLVLFMMEVVPDFTAAARLAFRVARAVFLGVAVAVAIVRLIV